MSTEKDYRGSRACVTCHWHEAKKDDYRGDTNVTGWCHAMFPHGWHRDYLPHCMPDEWCSLWLADMSKI